jgi:hypothetical protein
MHQISIARPPRRDDELGALLDALAAILARLARERTERAMIELGRSTQSVN